MKLNKSSIKKSSTKRFNESKDKWQNLQNILDRGGAQTGETDFSFQVLGIYSLPDQIKKLVESGSCDAWSFVVKFSDIELGGGKFNPREPTKEELKEIENKKKPPPKVNKKDAAAVKAEEDRLAQEQKEKEEEEKAFQDKLNKMSPEEQKYYLKELPTREPWISFPEGATVGSVKKIGEKFIQLEEDINSEQGGILELQYIPPPDEDPKKRAKPKGILPEEVKPVYLVAWVDFSEFHKVPGSTELTLRAKMLSRETYEKRIDDLESKINKKVFNPWDEQIEKMLRENSNINNTNSKENPNDKSQNNISQNNNSQNQNLNENSVSKVQDEPYRDNIEKAETYIYLKIFMSQPVNPVLPDVELPEPIDLLKKEKPPKKPITQEEIEKDLLRQFKIAIAAIAKVYDEAMGESAKGNLIRREKGSSSGSNSKKEEKEGNIYKFLEKFNTSGRADLLKEKLKKFIVRIVREKYGKKNEPVKGVYKDKRDQFYSELYAYLTDSIKKATNEFVELKKEELHENIITSFTQTKNEIMDYIKRENNEPEDKRLLRLSKENELLNDYNKAVKYYKSRLLLDPNKDAWLNYSNLAKKLEDTPEVETALTNAISLDPENCDINMQLIFCGLLYVKGQINNAINYLNLFLLKKGLNNTDHIFNAFLSFLYKEKNNFLSPNEKKKEKEKNAQNEALSKKHWEAAKLFKMKSLPPDELKPPPEEKPPVEEEDPKNKNKKNTKDNSKDKKEDNEEKEELYKKGNPRLHPEYKQPVLTSSQMDSIWFDTAFLFNRFNFYEISEKLLENVTEETKGTTDFKNQQAKVLLFRKEFQRVIELCNDIIKENKLAYDSYIIKGHALYNLSKYEEAEESYIKAIRFKPQEKKFDEEMLVKLGLAYIKRERWNDAKVIFKQILRDNAEQSFAWRYLGYALTKLGEYKEAEKSLMKANLLDVENPLIWAYLAIFDLNTGKKNQALECFNELNKVNFNDVNILKQIGNLFLDLEEYQIAINIFKKIKDQEKTDSECYLKIAGIYKEKLGQRSDALSILKEGVDKVLDDKAHLEMEELIKKIEIEEENEFIGLDTTGESGDNKEINENEIKNEGDNNNMNINDNEEGNKNDVENKEGNEEKKENIEGEQVNQ